MTFDKYIAIAKDMGVTDAVEFSTEDIVFDPRTFLKCSFGCSDFGKGNTCPLSRNPLLPWDYERIFTRYKKGVIIHTHDKALSQKASLEIERVAFLDGFHFAFSLSDCALCKDCAGLRGKECVNEKLARPAFHSVGIDVFTTVHKLGLPLYPLKDPNEEQNWYSAVFID